MIDMKSKQKLLVGHGTVEDHKKSQAMFMALFEAMFERPIIGSVGWVDSITREQKDRIRMERVKQIREADGKPITEATDYEALIYRMTLSGDTLLGRTAQRMYYHLFKKFFPDNSDFIPDYEAKLDYVSEQELTRLKQWLYKTSKRG